MPKKLHAVRETESHTEHGNNDKHIANVAPRTCIEN